MHPMRKENVLHLGAGRNLDSRFLDKRKFRYIANDIEPLDSINWPYDLDVQPWPLPSDHFHRILAVDILEHLSDTKLCIEECWRCLVINGILEIQVPFFGSFAHATDMTHKRGFTPDSFGFFLPVHAYCSAQPWYTHARFECLRYQLDQQDMKMFEVPDLWRSAMLSHKTVGNIQITLRKLPGRRP